MVTTRSRRRLPGKSQPASRHPCAVDRASLPCLLPLLLIVSASFSQENDIAPYGYSLIPRNFTTFAYTYILKVPASCTLLRGDHFRHRRRHHRRPADHGALCLYVARPDFTFRKGLAFYVFFTMLFNGGLVPWYILITQYLHLKNTIWALILPAMVRPGTC